MARPKIGDIIEIETSKGLAYALYTHEHAEPPKYGSLLRVFERLYVYRPESLAQILTDSTRFSASLKWFLTPFLSEIPTATTAGMHAWSRSWVWKAQPDREVDHASPKKVPDLLFHLTPCSPSDTFYGPRRMSLEESLDIMLSVAEAKMWCSTTESEGSGLRSQSLRPHGSLFEAFKSSSSHQDLVLSQKKLVNSVINSRHEALKELAGISSPSSSLGKIIAVELASSMYDGLARDFSDGFFDESDAPPWDTWVSMEQVGEKHKRDFLLAWVPETYWQVANEGAKASGGECIYFLPKDNLTKEQISVEIHKLVAT